MYRNLLVAVLVMLSVRITVRGSGVQQTGMTLPFTENFVSTAIGPAWTVHSAKGNTLQVADGVVKIEARPGTPAHIERKLSRDLVRASCIMQSTGPEATASLFVYWDASNFVQIGLNRPGAGRMEAREVLGTYAHDHDLGPWLPGQWHTLAIEVARDCIRCLASDDGKHFKCLHVSRRPPRLAGVPALLIIGQDAEAKMFPPPNAWINPPATNGLNVCQVREVEVTALTSRELAASSAERRTLEAEERDGFGEQELAAREDPTFESVSRHYPPLKWSREVVGVKDHPFDVGVAADGSLQLSDDIANYKKPIAFFEIGDYRFGSGTTACSKRLLNGYMPIVLVTDQHDSLEFQQTVFGYTENLSPDGPLSAYVRFRATNRTDSASSIELRLRVQPASDKSPSPHWQMSVPAHGSQAVDLELPYAILQSPARVVPAEEFDGKLAEVTAYWEKFIGNGSRFEIPEQRVQDAYRAWIAYNFLNVAKRGDVYHVCDGSGFYTQVYGYSAALYCNNLDLLGYHDQAVRYLDSLLTFMHTNGLLAVNFGDTDTGATLWAMSEHYWLTRDANWLRRVAPKMLAMCNWIIEQRRFALAQAAAQPAITKGLIRYRPYADLLHPAADYFSNGYLCKGLAAAAGVLAEIGMNEEATRLQRESDAYRKDITVSMDMAVFTDHGMNILPAIPDTRELWKESDGSANGYYSIIAPCMLEAGLPAWNDPKAAMLVDALERRGGLTVGVSRFHDLVDHAYAYGYWMNCLQRDEVKRVILGLYGSMAYGMSRGTYAAVECTAIRTGENYWTLPHTYSNTQQLRLLRNMLLREDGDKLWIGQAIPRPWLARGKRVAATGAPTVFGPVSFSLSTAADGSMRVHLEPPTRSAPTEIIIRLRHPEHLKIGAVKGEGAEAVKVAGETLRWQPVTGPLDLDVRFK
jgi:hypothetical protein